MDEIPPVPPFLERLEDLLEPLVHIRDWRRRGEAAEPSLTVAEGLLHPYPLGDVASDQQDSPHCRIVP
jgi:hypothetical protein